MERVENYTDKEPEPYYMSFPELNMRLGFIPLWARGILGDGVNVAVIDTGISNAPDIRRAVYCDMDFTGQGDPTGGNTQHGTEIARAINAIAPAARIANLKVVPKDDLLHHRELTKETVCDAIQYCIDRYPEIRVINLSLWFSRDDCTPEKRCTVCSKVNEAVKKGIAVVSAAGNLGPGPDTITCPGNADLALTVTSTWTREQREWYEQQAALKIRWWEFRGKFKYIWGTSYSAAWSSGEVALLLSAYKEGSSLEIRKAMLLAKTNAREFRGIEGMGRCEQAFEILLSPERYDYELRNLYINAGNKDLAASNYAYIAKSLGMVTSYIYYQLARKNEYQKALQALAEVKKYLTPGTLPAYEKLIDEMSCYVRMRISRDEIK